LKDVGCALSPNRGDLKINEVASGLTISMNSPSFAFSPNLILPVQVPANRAASCFDGALTAGVIIAAEVGEGVGVSSSIGAGHRSAKKISKVAVGNAANARFILLLNQNPRSLVNCIALKAT
jgi:hypothetical protein